VISLKTKKRPVNLLIVEDNLGDVFLMNELLKTSRFPIRVCLTRDGDEALDALRQSRCFPDKVEPDLILLDLNLPRMDGREVLAEIKRDPGFKHIPVLIVTSSQNEKDAAMAYQNQAEFYVLKPMDIDHFAVVMEYIENFWIKNVEEP
jgi:two-component system, chemotaxis family, response regulator Rcp1